MWAQPYGLHIARKSIINIVITLRLNVGYFCKIKNDSQNEHYNGQAKIGYPKPLAAGAYPCSIGRIEEGSANYRAGKQTYTIARLGKVDACGSISGRS